MPLQRLAKLEETTGKLERIVEALSDNLVLLQQVIDFRAKKGAEILEWGKAEFEGLHQELDNKNSDMREIRAQITLIQQRFHQLSGMIMADAGKLDELAEYIGLLEANQEQMKRKLHIQDGD